MNLVTLTETIIKKIVSDPESVSIKEFDSEDANTEYEQWISEKIKAEKKEENLCKIVMCAIYKVL